MSTRMRLRAPWIIDVWTRISPEAKKINKNLLLCVLVSLQSALLPLDGNNVHTAQVCGAFTPKGLTASELHKEECVRRFLQLVSLQSVWMEISVWLRCVWGGVTRPPHGLRSPLMALGRPRQGGQAAARFNLERRWRALPHAALAGLISYLWGRNSRKTVCSRETHYPHSSWRMPVAVFVVTGKWRETETKKMFIINSPSCFTIHNETR